MGGSFERAEALVERRHLWINPPFPFTEGVIVSHAGARLSLS
jgi:hypothetical protein